MRLERQLRKEVSPMFGSLIVIVAFLVALASALNSDGRGDVITARPYNNPYSDATGAREDHVG
jgi:hypothetical protein